LPIYVNLSAHYVHVYVYVCIYACLTYMICRCWIPTLLSRVHIVTAPCRRTGTILEVVLAGDWMGQGHFRSSPPYPTHQFWVLLGQGRPSMSYLIIVMPSTLVMVKTLGPQLLWFWPCYHILGLTGLWIRVWEMLFLGTLHGWREARKLPVCMTSPKNFWDGVETWLKSDHSFPYDWFQCWVLWFLHSSIYGYMMHASLAPEAWSY
jgi:hypothetical protein